jgi:hypothetical protein
MCAGSKAIAWMKRVMLLDDVKTVKLEDMNA